MRLNIISRSCLFADLVFSCLLQQGQRSSSTFMNTSQYEQNFWPSSYLDLSLCAGFFALSLMQIPQHTVNMKSKIFSLINHKLILCQCKIKMSEMNCLNHLIFVGHFWTLSNNVKFCPVLSKDVQLCQVMSKIVQICQMNNSYVML